MKQVYNDRDDNIRKNILLKNIMKYYKNSEVIVIHSKYDFCKDYIIEKSKLFSDLFITEEKFLSENRNADIYILMNIQMFDYLEDVEAVVKDKHSIFISREPQIKKERTYSKDELKFIHSKKWREKIFLNGNEIIEWIKETIDIAEDRIYLECPWFNEEAFDDDFIEKIENAVLRGVDVRIKYGINLEKDSRSKKTLYLIGKIRSLGKYDNLKLIESNSHVKTVFIDNLYLSGSLNFGSNNMKDINAPKEKANISIYNNFKQINEIKNSFKLDNN